MREVILKPPPAPPAGDVRVLVERLKADRRAELAAAAADARRAEAERLRAFWAHFDADLASALDALGAGWLLPFRTETDKEREHEGYRLRAVTFDLADGRHCAVQLYLAWRAGNWRPAGEAAGTDLCTWYVPGGQRYGSADTLADALIAAELPAADAAGVEGGGR